MTIAMTREFRSRVTRLVDKVGAHSLENSLDEYEVDEVFARAAWSGLGEPGDRMVGLLVRAMGASHALQLLIDSAPATHIAKEWAAAAPLEADEWLTEAIGEALERWKPRLSQSDALSHLERAERIGATLITPESEYWPHGVDDLGEHAPVALWARGSLRSLNTLDRAVSVVGARASTGYGEHVTMELVSELVDQRFTVVSGAAYGIDGMAHRTTLASAGTTIAVLAGGIDRLYPSGHDALLNRIIETGLVVTELPCGFAPTKWRFLQRNRLIAAMSAATVVVEAGWRSGSLNTAHHALELSRPVGVVPGPVTSASSAGCHRLLREAPAICVTTAADIIELTGIVEADTSALSVETQAIHPFASRVLDALSARKGRSGGEIAVLTGLSVPETLAVLGLLELADVIREVPTGWVKVSP